MMFRYQKDDEVILKAGESHAWFLPTGSRGVVFCQYTTTPPSYEVNFEDVEGQQFGTIVDEDEIEAVAALPLTQREAVSANS